MDYAQPKNISEAVALLAKNPYTVLSGGTDIYPAMLERPAPEQILDIHGLEELRYIQTDDKQTRIGANVTWSDIIAADLPAAFDALKLAAREVGSVQIQNRATLAGNICNASPAADGVPPLLILNAEVELMSTRGRRCVPLQQFILGNRHTLRKPSELVSAIVIPHCDENCVTTFRKLGARKYLIISISMVAARLNYDSDDRVSEAAISVGSCSEVAQRLVTLEQALLGQRKGQLLNSLVSGEHLSHLAPIRDVRSTIDYRRDCSLELVKRVLSDLNVFPRLSSDQ